MTLFNLISLSKGTSICHAYLKLLMSHNMTLLMKFLIVTFIGTQCKISHFIYIYISTLFSYVSINLVPHAFYKFKFILI